MSTTDTENQVPEQSANRGSTVTTGHDGEKTHTKTDDFGPAPDGGLRAWLVAAGAGFVLFAGLGYVNAIGVFIQYYLTHQLRDKSPDDVAWIGSITAFLQLAVGAVAGPAFDRYGAWILRPATVLYVFTIMMISLCKEYWQFMLAQGVLLGMVLGVLMFPALAAVSQYFEKKKAAAFGLVVSGSSIGGVVFPIILSKMLNSTSLGFGWTVRIVGFITLPLLTFSCIVIRPRLPPRTTTFFIWAAFRQADFLLVFTSLFFIFMGMWTPLFYLPSYAASTGMSPILASYLLAILNAASTFGRIIPGILADKFGQLNVFAIGGTLTGVIIFVMTQATSTAALIVYSIVFGFCSGTIISGASAAFTIIAPSPQDAGTYMGMGMAVGSIASLIGPPVNGALVGRYHGYLYVCIFSGTMCLVGGLVAFLAKAVTPKGIFGRT